MTKKNEYLVTYQKPSRLGIPSQGDEALIYGASEGEALEKLQEMKLQEVGEKVVILKVSLKKR